MHAKNIISHTHKNTSVTAPLQIASQARSTAKNGSLSTFATYLLDMSIILASLLLDDLIFQSVYGASALTSPLFIAVLMLGWTGVSLYSGVYTGGASARMGSNIHRALEAVILLMLVSLAVFYLTDVLIPRAFLLSLFALMMGFVSTWRLLARALISANGAKSAHKTVLIVGANELGLQVAEMIKQSWQNSQIIGFVDNHKHGTWAQYTVLGKLENITQLIHAHNVDEVIVTLPHNDYEHVNQMVLALKDKAV